MTDTPLLLAQLTEGTLAVETGTGPNVGLVAITTPGAPDSLVLPWHDAVRVGIILLTAATKAGVQAGADPDLINLRVSEAITEVLSAQ